MFTLLRESASVEEPSIREKGSGLRWPVQVSASVPFPALTVPQLGRAFQGHFFQRRSHSYVTSSRRPQNIARLSLVSVRCVWNGWQDGESLLTSSKSRKAGLRSEGRNGPETASMDVLPFHAADSDGLAPEGLAGRKTPDAQA